MPPRFNAGRPGSRSHQRMSATARAVGKVLNHSAAINSLFCEIDRPFGRQCVSGEKVFIGATKLFEWSKGQNCRFYVIVRDATN